MKLFSLICSRFRGPTTPNAGLSGAKTDNLVHELSEMRGNNITVVDGSGSPPAADDEIANTVAKARDMHTVNMGAEGKLLSNSGRYRTSK